MDTTLQQKQIGTVSWITIFLSLGKIVITCVVNFGAVCSLFRILFDLLSLFDVQIVIQWPPLLNVPTLSGCAALSAYMCARKRWRVTAKSTVQALPFHFVETTFWIALLFVATFFPLGSFYSFVPRLLLGFTAVALDLLPTEKIRKVAPSTPIPPSTPAPAPIPVIEQKRPTCSICRQPSLYEVCMECERTHRKEIQRVRSQNWRAKKSDEPATLTLAEWLQTLEFFHYHCAYCQTGPYECMEHYHPLGFHHRDGGTTATNCVPACYKCNGGKSNKEPEEDELDLHLYSKKR